MLTYIKTVFENAKESDIADFEDKFGVSLPEDYKAFLKKYNGGEPRECAVSFLAGGGGIADNLFGLGSDLNYSIEYANEDLEYIPDGLIKIAYSPNGDYFLLSTRNDSFGRVYYLNHELMGQAEFDLKNNVIGKALTKVSDSFSELLDNLYEP